MFDAIRQTLDAEHRASPLYRWSFAYRLVRDRMDRRMLSNRYRAAFHDAYFGTDEDRAEWLDAQRNLAAIVTAARARGVRIGLVVFPVLIDLDPAIYPFADVCDAVSAYAILQGVPTMSLLPAFLGKQDRALWVSDVDQHPNADAHAIAADALVPFVRALL